MSYEPQPFDLLQFKVDLCFECKQGRAVGMLFQQLVDLLDRGRPLLALEHPFDAFNLRDDVFAAELDFLSAAARALCVQIRRHGRFFRSR